MKFQAAAVDEFSSIRAFYWDLIDAMKEQADVIGWKKGIYPTDDFLQESLAKGELYTLKDEKELCACVILNSSCNEGYEGAPWSRDCLSEEVWIPHALAVRPDLQGAGIGKRVVSEILTLARKIGKKAVRLDILGTNQAAERLYTRMGFQFVQAKDMFYEDTGWTEYKIFEQNL